MTRAQDTASGRVELLADADRPGGWLLLVDRIRQSYVDLEDPSYLDFEYIQTFATVLETLPDGPLAVTHIGGAGCTFARYIAAVRPGSTQIVLEPDAALTELVRERLPLPRNGRIRIRAVDGRTGIAALRAASADVVVLDAFAGGRVPAELTTREFLDEVRRVLRPDGLLLANVADGPPMTYSRRLVATVRTALPETALIAESGVVKGRRFGNIVLAASGTPLAIDDIRRALASTPFPRTVSVDFGRDGRPLTDADSLRSPAPPDETWRVGDWQDD